MPVKFENVDAGTILYDRHKYIMGNTTLRSIGEWKVRVFSVDREKGEAVVSWNGNPPKRVRADYFKRLFDWSMYDDGVEVERGLAGAVLSVRKKKRANKDPKP